VPVTITFEAFHPNAILEGTPTNTGPVRPDLPNLATAGAGEDVGLKHQPISTGTDEDTVDYPAGYVTLKKDGQPLGTFMVSAMWRAAIDEVTVDGKTYKIALRFKREYKPYKFELIEATHETFTGTNIPKNFASKIRLIDPERGEDREVLIYMNHPLRHRGETFYQYQMAAGEGRTVLQVVRNPAWGGPYISCIMVAVGMTMHFGITLTRFLKKQMKAEGLPHGRPQG